MDLEKLINQTVMHKTFGKGIICSIDEKYLGVDFTEKGKVSKFPYPSCFNGFLTVEDSDLQTEIASVLEVWKQESGTVQKEELRNQYEKTMQGIAARRLAMEEKKLKAAQRAMEHRSAYSNTNFNKKKSGS